MPTPQSIPHDTLKPCTYRSIGVRRSMALYPDSGLHVIGKETFPARQYKKIARNHVIRMLGAGFTLGIEHDPLGGTHRSRRIPDAETTQRMLQAGIDKVDREGLKVSFDLLRLEDLIVEAGVVRSAVYRRWPTKNYYYADLLRSLAGREYPGIAASGEASIEQIITLLHHHSDMLRTPDSRRALIIELCRLGAADNFDTMLNSKQWSVYLTITATLASLPQNEDLQSDLGHALTKSEQTFVEHMATYYGTLAEVTDYRLRADLGGINLQTVAQMAAAAIEGMMIDSLADKTVATKRFNADPFGTGATNEWSMPAIAFTSIMMTFLEPKPDQCELTDEEIAARINILNGLSITIAQNKGM